jgi:hypothetical protein
MQHPKFSNYGKSFCHLTYILASCFFCILNSECPEIKEAAIDALQEKHRENRLHHFTEADREKHINNWQ